jgi:ABC-type nickel/cobalt efflux system permease component RcnA
MLGMSGVRVFDRTRGAFADRPMAPVTRPSFCSRAWRSWAWLTRSADPRQDGLAAYLVGSRGTALHALFLGGTVTVTHTAGVYALGVVTLFLSQYIVPERLYPILEVVSGLLVVGIGAWLFGRRLLAALGLRFSGPRATTTGPLTATHRSTNGTHERTRMAPQHATKHARRGHEHGDGHTAHGRHTLRTTTATYRPATSTGTTRQQAAHGYGHHNEQQREASRGISTGMGLDSTHGMPRRFVARLLIGRLGRSCPVPKR